MGGLIFSGAWQENRSRLLGSWLVVRGLSRPTGFFLTYRTLSRLSSAESRWFNTFGNGIVRASRQSKVLRGTTGVGRERAGVVRLFPMLCLVGGAPRRDNPRDRFCLLQPGARWRDRQLIGGNHVAPCLDGRWVPSVKELVL